MKVFWGLFTKGFADIRIHNCHLLGMVTRLLEDFYSVQIPGLWLSFLLCQAGVLVMILLDKMSGYINVCSIILWCN